ncbi:MAG: hypothetical protein PHH06_03325 [Candidatus Gracilibacteria bacterium]|nr:hypothetical protein [Candidatus Gracilibacteria bacterium]
MFFRKKKESHTKKLDKLVTGLIIGGAVAGMIGLSKTEKGKEVTEVVKKEGGKVAGKAYALFGKALAKGVSLFCKKK